jgi:hypothetical protein
MAGSSGSNDRRQGIPFDARRQGSRVEERRQGSPDRRRPRVKGDPQGIAVGIDLDFDGRFDRRVVGRWAPTVAVRAW